MSTTSSSAKKDNPEQPEQHGKDFGTTAKRKSAGFIETADFKPNWLETGPLSLELLPESLDSAKGELVPSEIEELQDALQRFYKESGEMASGDNMPTFKPEIGDTTEHLSPEHAESASFEIPLNQLLKGAAADAVECAPPDTEETTQVGLAEQITPISPVDTGFEGPGATDISPWPLPDTEITAVPANNFIYDDDAAIESSEAFGEYVEEKPAIASTVETIAKSATTKKPEKTRKPKVKRRRDRLTVALLFISLALLSAATFIYLVNPFARLALGSASLARPAASSDSPSPENGSGAWCLSGGFLKDPELPRLIDSGEGGDFLAEDGVFSLEHVIAIPGTYEWQVIDCANPELTYPQAPAWVTTTAPDQAPTFNFDSNERSDPLFFPIPFVVSADDGADDFHVLGNFQDWNPKDTSGQMQKIGPGLYLLVRRMARPGEYEAYIISGDKDRAIDAYGRTTAPIPFAFETERDDEHVAFLVDTDRGRASVLYDMSPTFTSLAYNNGYRIFSLILGGAAILLLLGTLARLVILNNKAFQLEAGCPDCGRQELIRISRHPSDRLLHFLGIPVYRYRCRHCTWEGTRLSETGMTVSPGVEIAHSDF